jgi:hypothetical protein
LLYLDECDIHLHPKLRKIWMFKGQQKEIPAPGTNEKLHIFGALNFASNRVTYDICHHKSQWQMETFLLKLFTEVYPQDYLIVTLDSVSYHKTPLIENLLLDYADRVFVLWLPKYCPKLSLIERFWEHMKQVTFDSYYWGDAPGLEQAAHNFFKEHNENPESDFAISFRLSQKLICTQKIA